MDNSNPQNQNIDQPSWEDNLLDYMFGALPPDEAARFERELSACQERVVLAQRYREVIGLLGSVAPPAEPPPGHKDRFLARLALTPQEQPSLAPTEQLDDGAATTSPASMPGLVVVAGPPASRDTEAGEPGQLATPRLVPLDRIEPSGTKQTVSPQWAQPRWAVAFASVAAALALLLGLWAFTLNSELGRVRGQVNIPPGYQSLAILPQEPYTATAVAIFNPNARDATIHATGLEALPEGKVYELWFLPAEGNPVPAGTFRGDPAGRAVHTQSASQPLSNYAGFAVTIEDAPGSQTPQGPIIMAGKYR